MTPTQILKDEHRVIERVLGCLEKMAEQASKEKTLSAADARDAITFLKTFADAYHHGKEEDLLYAAMVEIGFPRDAGPIGVMLHEHTLGRSLIKGMADSLAAFETGEKEAVLAFARNAVEYAGLLSGHIQKENNILYPMADNNFSNADQQRLLAAFARVEKEKIGEETHGKMLAIAERLGERYKVSTRSESTEECEQSSGCFSCGGVF
jgi:hemerythrin-like domain-containing protein